MIFFFIFVALTIYVHIKYLWDRAKIIRLHRMTLGDYPMEEEMILVRFGEHLLPMRYMEKLEKWDNFSHAEKRKLSRALNTKVKRGKINPDRLGNQTLKILNDEPLP